MKVEFTFFDGNETEHTRTFESFVMGHFIQIGDMFLFREVLPGVELPGYTDDPDVEHLLIVESRIWNLVDNTMQIILEKRK